MREQLETCGQKVVLKAVSVYANVGSTHCHIWQPLQRMQLSQRHQPV